MVLVLSRSRSVTPAENGSFDRSGASSGDYAAYSYVNMNSNRPPKILESPLDSKSLLSGNGVISSFLHKCTTVRDGLLSCCEKYFHGMAMIKINTDMKSLQYVHH